MHAAAEPSTGGAPLGAGAAKLVAGAPFAEVLTLPQQRRDNASGAHFPLVLGCTAAESTSLAAVCEWLATHKAAVEAALVEHGGLYLRGFPVGDAQAFDALMVRLSIGGWCTAHGVFPWQRHGQEWNGRLTRALVPPPVGAYSTPGVPGRASKALHRRRCGSLSRPRQRVHKQREPAVRAHTIPPWCVTCSACACFRALT